MNFKNRELQITTARQRILNNNIQLFIGQNNLWEYLNLYSLSAKDNGYFYTFIKPIEDCYSICRELRISLTIFESFDKTEDYIALTVRDTLWDDIFEKEESEDKVYTEIFPILSSKGKDIIEIEDTKLYEIWKIEALKRVKRFLSPCK